MVKCITQSGKNCTINNWWRNFFFLHHPGRALDFKAKDLIGHLWVSLIIDQSECLVCYLFLHWINYFLHCFKKKNALLLTNQNGEIFSCTLLCRSAFSKRFVGAGHSEEGGGPGGESTLPSAHRACTFRGFWGHSPSEIFWNLDAQKCHLVESGRILSVKIVIHLHNSIYHHFQ